MSFNLNFFKFINNIMTIYLYLLITLFCWGIGQTLLKIGFTKSTPINSYLLGGFIGLIVWLPYIIINYPNFFNFKLFFPLCLATSLCYLTFYYALEAGELSIASAILGTYPIYTIIFSVFVIGEKLKTNQWIALIIIILGIVTLSYISSDSSKNNFNNNNKYWLFTSITSSILIGLADGMCKVIIEYIGVSAFSLYINIAQIIMGIFLKICFERKNFSFVTLKSKYSIIGIFLLNIGGVFFTLALKIGQASIIVPLSSTYIAIVTILSWLFLNEKMNFIKILSILAIILGIMIL